MMETSVKNVKAGKTLHGLVEAIAALRLRVMEIQPQNSLPYEMFKNGTPYEASRTYTIMKAEFERTKSMVAIETHGQALRCS
jgi:hypothetical protein